MEFVIVIVVIGSVIGVIIILVNWAKKAHEQAEYEEEVSRRNRECLKMKKVRPIQRAILEMVANGQIPDIDWKTQVNDPLPFRLLKSERLLYVFPYRAQYAEMKVRRQIVGRSAGTSVRIAQGWSVRVGASQGTPVENDEIHDRGFGTLAISNKCLLFNGDSRSFRIRLDKIVSVSVDGQILEVVRERASQLPEYLALEDAGDAAFAADLILSVESGEVGALTARTIERHVEDFYVQDMGYGIEDYAITDQ